MYRYLFEFYVKKLEFVRTSDLSFEAKDNKLIAVAALKKLAHILCLILLVGESPVFANDGRTITYLGIEEGLSNNSVRCIYKDRKGFMWFGTYDGLNRYDGYEFKVFRNRYGDSASLINNWIYAICERDDREMWIGTRQGLCILNPFTGKFSPAYYTDAGGQMKRLTAIVKDLKTDGSGNMFVGTQGMGLFWFKKGRNVAERIPLEAQTGFEVPAMLMRGNDLWVFVQNKGLYRFDRSLHRLILAEAAVKSALGIELENGRIWIGTGQGIYKFDISTKALTPNPAISTTSVSSGIMHLMYDKANNSMWVGTNGGGINIIDLSNGRVQSLLSGDKKRSLSSNVIYTIFDDSLGRKWIGTLRGGIDVIDTRNEKFITIAHDPGDPASLTNNFIYSFCEAADGKVWIGMDGAGVNIWDRRKNTFTPLTHSPGNPTSLSDNSVTRIRKDHSDNLWLSTFSGGINRFNMRRNDFDHFACIDPISGKVNNVVFSLFEDNEKIIWAGTLRTADGVHGGLYRFNGAKNLFEIFDSNLSDLFSIEQDREDRLWAGNLTSLILVDRMDRKHLYYNVGGPVHTIVEDKKGNFWVGTEGAGLVLFDRKAGKITKRFTTEDGLCSNEILNILEDNDGNLWISTFNGLAKFDPARLQFVNYFQSDGLQSNQFHYNACIKLSTGEFVFGGIKGFTIFSPKNITADKTKPPLWITGVRVNNQKLEDQPEYSVSTDTSGEMAIRVPFSKASFSFDFAALEYAAPGKIRYSYKMSGWDHDWTSAGTVRTANYSHLQEGGYTFLVRNTNSEGDWSDKEQAFRIVVLPPWYRTFWAYMLYFIAAASLIYFYWVYRNKQTKLKYEVRIAQLNAEKEKAEHEKERTEREAERIVNEKERELYERRLSFFTNMAHEFRTPLTLIINPVKELLDRERTTTAETEKEDLGIVYRNSRRLLSLVDQLLLFRKAESGLDSINPTKFDLHILCEEAYLCFVQQAKTKELNYEFDCKRQKIWMFADREKMEIILYNLLSNALKYVPRGGKVSLQVRNKKDQILVRVINTGNGIPIEVGDKIFDKFYRMPGKSQAGTTGFGIGLYLVKYFAEAHKGSVSYTSEPERETVFSVCFPKEVLQHEVSCDDGVTNGHITLDDLKEGIITGTDWNDKDSSGEGFTPLISDKQSVLVVDDDLQMRNYVAKIFKEKFIVYEAGNAEDGFRKAKDMIPDIIISDIQMGAMNGIEFCRKIKKDEMLSHIPVILLTGATSSALKIEGVENGADDYITKPFEKELLTGRVNNLLQSRSNLQKYFFSEITLNKNHNYKISEDHKAFLERCVSIVEGHFNENVFTIGMLAREMGMSHSAVYKRIRLISGQSLTSFIRFVRLRKAAELFINTSSNVNEVATLVGFNDGKYFREQFNKFFGMNPSDYIKKYRKSFQGQYRVNKDKL